MIARLDTLSEALTTRQATTNATVSGAPADAFLRSGKVRDLHMLNDGRLLLVASDRISAFDVVLPTLIPTKAGC